MAEEKKSGLIGETAQVVAGVVQSVPLYEDAIQPWAKQAGKSLELVGKLVNTALLPLHAFVWGGDKLWEFIDEKVTPKLASVPQENIQTPAPNVAVPVLEALRYTGAIPELAELFAGLLATAMDKSTATTAHPAFPSIIKSLTPDEAKILRHMASKRQLALVDVYLKLGESQELVLAPDQSDLQTIGCEIVEAMPTYLRNLERLGLIELPPSVISYTDKTMYEVLEARLRAELPILVQHATNSEIPVQIRRKMLNLTPLGAQLFTACNR